MKRFVLGLFVVLLLGGVLLPIFTVDAGGCLPQDLVSAAYGAATHLRYGRWRAAEVSLIFAWVAVHRYKVPGWVFRRVVLAKRYYDRGVYLKSRGMNNQAARFFVLARNHLYYVAFHQCW